ncbi:vWA domain-containing protein [Buchananella hordeovulneris]|uniref:Uncharacterized protein n=1 Tax=Buchananella hordeovulneris TaxID=52770 RepID=A0A1Q5PU01_9ACTO|nr:VWA-like domain-containing protein [Buchananella hordeovulneris]OKL50860.1 hypothetical protein BSZ40_10530 [Buchananella hordeovulneris]
MSRTGRGRSGNKVSPATAAFEAGVEGLRRHPIFRRLEREAGWVRRESAYTPPQGWVRVLKDFEYFYVHPTRREEATHWTYLLARALLSQCLDLWEKDRGEWSAWSSAVDVTTAQMAQGLRVGTPPPSMTLPDSLPQWDTDRWYREFVEHGVPEWAYALSLAGPGEDTLEHPSAWTERHMWDTWPEIFAAAVASSVREAVEAAAGAHGGRVAQPGVAEHSKLSTSTWRARDWFISSFPLLGSMVASFTFIEDADICRREQIEVAAVDEELRTVYLNPIQQLSEESKRFVIAHEVLHVALRHMRRCQGRDPYLWNVACDFVINDWLLQMEVGQPPPIGMLHDPELRDLSTEEVYDRLVGDLRRARRLRTLAGRQGDILRRRIGGGAGPFTDLDAFCREQLGKGLLLHQQQGRGLLPVGLLEEINALLQPPIPWEVELAHWFDHHFPPIETRRTWLRLSRRQSGTPDIPRPRVIVDPEVRDGRTFGVVLDTSGSMDRRSLGRALGAIAAYAEAKEVAAVRLVCCDAAAYDLGWLPANEIAGRVELKGRGGTILQPGIDLLERAADFPKNGPVLIITDGLCDQVQVRRDHAFLLPPGARLPFPPRGEVFEMRD